MELQRARKIANDLCEELYPFCNKLNVAGSVQRKKPEVKDIEICCVPKMIPSGQPDLFNSVPVTYSPNLDFRNVINNFGRIIKGNSDGSACR